MRLVSLMPEDFAARGCAAKMCRVRSFVSFSNPVVEAAKREMKDLRLGASRQKDEVAIWYYS